MALMTILWLSSIYDYDGLSWKNEGRSKRKGGVRGFWIQQMK